MSSSIESSCIASLPLPRTTYGEVRVSPDSATYYLRIRATSLPRQVGTNAAEPDTLDHPVTGLPTLSAAINPNAQFEPVGSLCTYETMRYAHSL
jgi:hypothetical protein